MLTYGSDAASSHHTNAYWYLDNADMVACDPSGADIRKTSNTGFIDRWDRMKQSKEFQLYGILHSDICNVPLYLLSGVRLQIRLTSSRTTFCLINKDKVSKVTFKILDAYLLVRRIRPNPHILTAHNVTLSRGLLARYNFTRDVLKTFTFSSGQQSLSIDNAVLGPIPKGLIFTMVKNTYFLGTMDSNP